MLKYLHNIPTGVQILPKVRQLFYWRNTRKYVEKYYKSCGTCMARKGPKTLSQQKLGRYNSSVPFKRDTFDFLGSFSKVSEKNKHILVVIDYFTKCPQAYLIPDLQNI